MTFEYGDKMKKKSTLQKLLNMFKTDARFDLSTDIGFRNKPKALAKLFKKQTGFMPKPQLFHPVVIKWSKKGVGFGELCFYQDGDKIYCDNEMMSKEFIFEVFMTILKKTILTEVQKPRRVSKDRKK